MQAKTCTCTYANSIHVQVFSLNQAPLREQGPRLLPSPPSNPVRPASGPSSVHTRCLAEAEVVVSLLFGLVIFVLAVVFVGGRSDGCQLVKGQHEQLISCLQMQWECTP